VTRSAALLLPYSETAMDSKAKGKGKATSDALAPSGTAFMPPVSPVPPKGLTPAAPLSPVSALFQMPPTRDIHTTHKEIIRIDTAGTISGPHVHVPKPYADSKREAADLGRDISKAFRNQSKSERASQIAQVERAGDIATHELFGGDKASMAKHDRDVKNWVKRPNGADFRKMVPRQDELLQSARTASQFGEMANHTKGDPDGEKFNFHAARLTSAMRAPTEAVRHVIDGSQPQGPVHPSKAPPAIKVEGGSSASVGAHQDRSDKVNQVGFAALKKGGPARSIMAMAAKSMQESMNHFVGPPDASNVHGPSFAPSAYNREGNKKLAHTLAAMANVLTTPGVQSPTAKVRAHPGSFVSPERTKAAATTGALATVPAATSVSNSPVRTNALKKQADVTPKIGAMLAPSLPKQPINTVTKFSGTPPGPPAPVIGPPIHYTKQKHSTVAPKIGAPVSVTAAKPADVPKNVAAEDRPARRTRSQTGVTPKVGTK
jgi:hypothetical protein